MRRPLQCVWCRHYRGGKTCSAFPDEIPDALWFGEHDHKDPYPGDRGIRYKAIGE